MQMVIWPYCPFCQRAMIVVHEKKAQCEFVEIDLQNKPEWFTSQCPTAKVPAVIDDQHKNALFESLAICEYLEDTYEPKLHPQDPWLKAANRAWMEQNGGYFGDLFNMIDAGSMEGFQKARNALIDKLQWLDYAVRGPFFNGNGFALIDAVSAPFMEALRQIEELTECRVFTNLPKLKEWAAQLAEHPSVVNALANDLHDHWYNKLVHRQSFLSQRVR